MSVSSVENDHSPNPDHHMLRSFSVLVGKLEEGNLNADASDTLEEIVMLCNEAIQHDRKFKASMTLAIQFSVENGVVITNATIAKKLPKPVRRTSLMHVAKGKFLSTVDPRQHALNLREVDDAKPVFRNLGDD